MHLHEALVEVSLVVEDRPADVVLGPGDRREVGVGTVATGEALVAGSQRVEEIDGVATRDPVARRPDVDLHAVTACRSTSGRRATGSRVATPSISSTRWEPATRASPVATV